MTEEHLNIQQADKPADDASADASVGALEEGKAEDEHEGEDVSDGNPVPTPTSGVAVPEVEAQAEEASEVVVQQHDDQPSTFEEENKTQQQQATAAIDDPQQTAEEGANVNNAAQTSTAAAPEPASRSSTTTPWYKKHLILVLLFVIVALVAAIVGIVVSQNNSNNGGGDSSEFNQAPQQPTDLAPSSSDIKPTSTSSPIPAASSSPIACVNKIEKNEQKIELPLEDAHDPIMAIYGENMVIVAQRGGGGPLTIVFYSWVNGLWQIVNTFHDGGLVYEYSVAISGKTAFVGKVLSEFVGGAGEVLVYDQVGDGWQEVEDPFIYDSIINHDRFGEHVDVDGDLACAGDYSGSTSLFRREGNRWVHYQTIEHEYYGDCSISGDKIAIAGYTSELGWFLQVYKHDEDLNRAVAAQDPISSGPIPRPGYSSTMDMSNNYLVYWDSWERDAFVYRWDENNQSFSFHQQLKVPGPVDNDLVLDKDVLVVGGINSHIFEEQDGSWKETETLDKQYAIHALSGRVLLTVTKNENVVYSLDLVDCPTAIDVSSTTTMAPSSSPSRFNITQTFQMEPV